ncbi:ribonuclease domain-containing protein [Nocardioides sp. MH1]|uniref:ribonuclease domain-containing protein n=1 Tax=Nocardioides sp. MH1 TaxID=3242490 RepID=UPI00352078E5
MASTRSSSARRGGGLGGAALVVLLALAAWWVQSTHGDTDDPAAGTSPSTSAGTSAGTSSAPGPTSSAPSGMPERDGASGLPYVALADLPPEAAEVVDLIDAGGPFPYEQDGGRFGNYEGLLPDRSDGYYREYTVETPGSDDRGARRIIGGDQGELYWTEDHYESFEVIWR